MKIREETLKELLAIARITSYDVSLKAVFDVAYDLYYENNFDDKKTNAFFTKADNLGDRALRGEKIIEKKPIKLSSDKLDKLIDDKLSDVDLFILLKGMIKQKETDSAFKLAEMIQVRFNDLLTEVDNLNDEIYWQNELSNIYFEDERDD